MLKVHLTRRRRRHIKFTAITQTRRLSLPVLTWRIFEIFD